MRTKEQGKNSADESSARSRTVAIIGTRGYPSYYGGFETAVRYLAPYLCDKGWVVEVYSRRRAIKPDDPEIDPRVRVRCTRGIDTRQLSTLTYGFTSMLSAGWRRPEVALIMNVANCIWLPLLKACRVPTVVNVDGIEWERKKWGRLARFVFKIGAKATARWADEIIVDSTNIGLRWKADFGRDGVYIPYGGTDSVASAAPLGLSSRSYVLVVSRFVPENSIDGFFSAAAQLAPDYQVVIVGSTGYGGQLDERARALSERYKSVHWLGHVSDDSLLFSLWQNAGAYFHGHTVGGTNPALVQAMMLGAPTVAVDTSFNREVLGTAGIFVDANSFEIEAGIRLVMEDRNMREGLATRARERARERFSWDAINARYDETLQMRARTGR